MNLERTMDEIEKNLNYASGYLVDLKSEFDQENTATLRLLTESKETIEILEEQNELLTERVEILEKENLMLNIELAEVTRQLIQLRHEK